MKKLDVENFKTSQILLLLLIIIFLLPFIYTLTTKLEFFDFSNTGEIGDTIGGITAPFINGLSAILVFLAFKAQIRANEIFKNQEQSRNILDQIKIIQEDKLNIEEVIHFMTNSPNYLAAPLEITILNRLNKITYFTSEIRLAYELIENHSGDKDFVYRKLFYLYVIRYKDLITNLEIELKKIIKHLHDDYEFNVAELLLEMEYIHRNLIDVNKYKTTANIV
ncbi:hypothetical protein DFQ09_1204 [Winogradskyella pacifica]|uniref:Phage abortive infection protein n=2 Tax=Winogradskyella pacifica TaxID=664642 RepID=A0A3D9LM36_9FLAO|nr:hypothetical protein DFQ09_1204 [Winogradskyella pacifica]